jgi:hypothetical protein
MSDSGVGCSIRVSGANVNTHHGVWKCKAIRDRFCKTCFRLKSFRTNFYPPKKVLGQIFILQKVLGQIFILQKVLGQIFIF